MGTIFEKSEKKERAIPQRMVLNFAVTDSAVNRTTSKGKFFDEKLAGACIGGLSAMEGERLCSSEERSTSLTLTLKMVYIEIVGIIISLHPLILYRGV